MFRAGSSFNPGNVSLTGGTISGLSSLALASGTAILGIAIARAPGAQSVTSSTALTNATSMSFPIGANEEWIVQVNADMGALLSTTGLQVAMNAPAGATVDFDVNLSDIAVTVGNVLSGSTQTLNTAISLAAATLTGITNAGVICDYWVLNGATPGNVQFQFAQATSSGTATTLRRGSWLVGWRVA